jgi:hypothetical protein
MVECFERESIPLFLITQGMTSFNVHTPHENAVLPRHRGNKIDPRPQPSTLKAGFEDPAERCNDFILSLD